MRVFPLPASATASQPAIATALSVNWTVPLGDTPETAAVNVTATPANAGLAELAISVVDGGATEHDGNLNDPIRVCQLPTFPLAWLL